MSKIKHELFTKTVPAKLLLFSLLLLIGAVTTIFTQESDVFPKPETYQTEGIPVIKNSEVANLFYDPAAIKSNLIWDADVKNRRLLVTDETYNVYLLNTPLNQPVKLFEKVVPHSIKTSPNGESFAYTSDYEDEDNYQLYLYDFKEKTTRKLITLTGKDESIDSFIWSKTGDFIYYMKVDYESKIRYIGSKALE